jgi:hypothetical protein
MWPNRLVPFLSDTFLGKLGGTLHERLRAMVTDMPETPNRVFLLELAGRSRRTTSLFALSLLATRVDSVFPYLDDRMVASALRWDPFWKRDLDLQKVLLDRAYPRYRDVPSSHSPREAVPPSYVRRVTHIFNGVVPSSPLRASRFGPQLRHGLLSRPPRGARPDCLGARGRMVVAAARAASTLGLDVRLASATFARLWAVPKLLKLERILSDCR